MTETVAEAQRRGEFARAVRALLRRPLLDRGQADDFALVVTHGADLRQWFIDKCGWTLVVEQRRGYARLRKLPAEPDECRMAMTRRSAPRPFTRRRYALFAIAVAALGDYPRQQVSLLELAERITRLSGESENLTTYDPHVGAERAALVDVLATLTWLGVLHVVDRSGDYDRSEEANALYDIDDRRLAQLLVAPRAPSACAVPAEISYEDRYGPQLGGADPSAPGEHPTPTDEQRRIRARHRIMRRLLDNAVVYHDELDPDERQYLQATIGPLSTWVEQAGLQLERRAEGWAAIDVTGESTDIAFPGPNSVVHQAALLLLDALTSATRTADWVPRIRVEHELALLLARHSGWARTYRTDTGLGLLTDQVITLLGAMCLVRAERGGVVLRPAAARYRPTVAVQPALTTEEAP